jgi:hypothetical protein
VRARASSFARLARRDAGEVLASSQSGEVGMPRTNALCILIVVALAPAAHAGSDPLLDAIRGLPPAVLIGGFGGGHSGASGPHGWFIGADTGWVWMTGSDVALQSTTSERRTNALGFGARAGYQLVDGLAVQARYDHLGVSSPSLDGPLSLTTAGVRYALPAELEPFAEAMVGPAYHGGTTSLAVGLAVGASVLASRHLTFDLTVRDWLVDIGGVHHAPTITLGITAGFGG